MNVFRFCRRSLLALPVFFMLAACNYRAGFLPEAEKGSSGLVSVKIRAPYIAGGNQNETITRAGGGSGEKRMAGQAIVQDLGGGILPPRPWSESKIALRQ